MTPKPDPPPSNRTSGSSAASAAEARLDFFRAFLALAEQGRGSFSLHDHLALDLHAPTGPDDDSWLFRGVRDLERSEVWRIVCALWEHIGDRVGDEYATALGHHVPDSPSHQLFFGYSLPIDQWVDPRSDGYPPNYYRDDADASAESKRLLHRRALAYGHAAEEAASNQRYALATLLRRKAGLAWVTSGWGERTTVDSKDAWTQRQLLEVAGEKWREAARAYFRACLFQSRASSDDEKGVTFESLYAPNDPDLVERDRWPAQPGIASSLDCFFGQNDDIARLTKCWKRWSEGRIAAYKRLAPPPIRWFACANVRSRSNTGLCNNLGVLEDALRSSGRVREARRLFGRRRRANLAAWLATALSRLFGAFVPADASDWPAADVPPAPSRRHRVVRAVVGLLSFCGLVSAALYHCFTGTGRGIARTLTCVAVLFAALFPLLYASTGHLRACTRAGCAVTHNWWAAMRFGLGQAVTVPPTDLVAAGTFGRWLAVINTVLAALALGYTVWVITRNSYGS